MGKNLYNLRFGVSTSYGHRSNIWRLWVTRNNDVYLTDAEINGRYKYSFHGSGVCQMAYSQEIDSKRENSHRWKREKTPSKKDFVHLICAIYFPTKYLSREFKQYPKKVTWFPAAPMNTFTVIEMGFTHGDANDVKKVFNNSGRVIVGFQELPNQEKFVLTCCHMDISEKDLFIKTELKGAQPNIVIAGDDPDNTGRPIRITAQSNPKNNEHLQIIEYGAYVDPKKQNA